MSCAFLAWVFAGVAPAQGAQKVVAFPVVPLPGEVGPKDAAEMTKAILEELRLNKDVEVIAGELPGAPQPSGGRPPAKSRSAYQQALAQLEEGESLAQRLRFPQAIRELNRGIQGLERNLELVEDYDQLLNAYILLSVAYLRRGKQSRGLDALQTVARLRTDLELDESKYPPMFMGMFAEAKQRVRSHETGSLRVLSQPEGAQVTLNGRALGSTPLRVMDIPPWDHHVVLDKDGHRWGRVVTVRAGRLSEEQANLGGESDAGGTVFEAMAANRFDRSVRRAVREAARKAGGDWMLVAVIGKGRGVYAVGAFLGSVKNGHWAALDPLAPDHDMLSASIEANNMTTHVVRLTERFRSDVGQETVAFIAGRSVKDPASSGRPLTETVVSFSGESGLIARAVVGARGSVTGAGARRPVSPVKSLPALEGEAERRAPEPIVRRPVNMAPRPASTDETPEANPKETTEDHLEKRTEIEGEELALVAPPPQKGRGPVLSGRPESIIEQAEAPQGVSPSAGAMELKASSEIAALEVGQSSSGEKAGNLDAGTTYVPDTPVYQTWWFWTVVGVGAAAIIGTTAGVVASQTGKPDSVKVFAVW